MVIFETENKKENNSVNVQDLKDNKHSKYDIFVSQNIMKHVKLYIERSIHTMLLLINGYISN